MQAARTWARTVAVTSRRRHYAIKTTPMPPKLPKAEQEEFERLQRQAHAQSALDMSDAELEEYIADLKKTSESIQQGKALPLMAHPQFRDPYPEFEGDVNPATGEMGGPKQDPLRHGDYAFNGRVTDF